MIPDELSRTTRIPIRIVDGVPQPFYGPSWPELKDGTVGELTLPAHGFVNPEDEVLLSSPLGTEILPPGTILLAAVSRHAVGVGIRRKIDGILVESPYAAFVELKTQEGLRLQLRGTKKGRLERCRCAIPSLDEHRDSVNEAYTRISEVYEPDRRSHTGNVFHKIMYSRVDGEQRTIWSPLENLRDDLEAKLEVRFGSARVET